MIEIKFTWTFKPQGVNGSSVRLVDRMRSDPSGQKALDDAGEENNREQTELREVTDLWSYLHRLGRKTR